MTLKETLNTIIGPELTADVMQIANAAQRKYVATEKGRIARKKANLKYRTKPVKADANIVPLHLTQYKADNPLCECEIVTNLWKHYCDKYECIDKTKLTRKQYQTLLEQIVKKQNPHWRGGRKYYADGYDLTS